MSRKRQNNHYHYAEKFSDRDVRRRNKAYFALAPVVFTLLVLFAFGCISTTFSVFVTSPDSSVTTSNGLRIAIRNKKINDARAEEATDVTEVATEEPTEAYVAPEIDDKAKIVISEHSKDLSATGRKAELTSVGASAATIYVDYTAISNWSSMTYGNTWCYSSPGYFLSVTGSDNNSYKQIDHTNTGNVGNYNPTKDTFITGTAVRTGIYKYYLTSAQATQAVLYGITLWSRDTSENTSVYDTCVSHIAYDTSKNYYKLTTSATWHNTNKAYCVSSSSEAKTVSSSAPAAVISGTNVMFYIQSYSGSDLALSNGNANTYIGQTGNLSDGISYMNIAKTDLATYYYVTNNKTGWGGVDNTGIQTAKGGEFFKGNATVSTSAAKTATTTLESNSFRFGDYSEIELTTSANGETVAVANTSLYYQYYLDGTLVNSALTDTLLASTSEQTYKLDVSSLAVGPHTLQTVLTDGNIYYIAQTDTINVASAAAPIIDTFTIDSESSATKNLGETATLASTKSNSDDTVTYSSSDDSIAVVSGSTVKAMGPGTATITAHLQDSVNAPTVTLTVRTPTITSVTYATNTLKKGESVSAPTVEVSNINNASTVTCTYSMKSGSETYGSVDSSTGVLTGLLDTNTTQYVDVSATITYNGSTYTAATSEDSQRGAFTVYAYYLVGFGTNTWGTSGNRMTYNPSTDKWSTEQVLTGGGSYTKETDYGFKIFKSNAPTNDQYYGSSSVTLSESSNNPIRLYSNSRGQSSNIGLTPQAFTGTYIFEFTDSAIGTDINTTNNANETYYYMDVTVRYPHKITLDNSGVTTSSWPDDIVLKYNTAPSSAPANPTATGYAFAGWYQNDLTTAYDFTANVTANSTAYAKWTANTYTVTLDQQSGSGGSSTVTATYGSPMPTITVPTRTGYTFDGYFTEVNGGGTQYYDSTGTTANAEDWNIANSTTTLYAKWTKISYTITLRPSCPMIMNAISGGWSTNDNGSTYTMSYDVESATITLPTPTSTGYTFDKWYTTGDSSQTAVNTVPNGSHGNLDFTGSWSEKNPTITLNQSVSSATTHAQLKSTWGAGLAGISRNNDSGATTTFNRLYSDTSTVTLPTAEDFLNVPIVSGSEYIFIGWYTHSSFTGDPVTRISGNYSENTTYYAKWAAPHTVTFKNNVTGDTIGTLTVADGQTIDQNEIPGHPPLDGFTANGWSSNVNSTVTADTTVYANYTINAPYLTLSVSSSLGSTGSGTENDPLVVPYGSVLTGTGTLSGAIVPNSDPVAYIAYESGSTLIYQYSFNDGSWTDTNGSSNSYTATLNTLRTISVNSPSYFNIMMKTFYRRADNSSWVESSPTELRIYYYAVGSPITSFGFLHQQRIFMSASDSSSSESTATIQTTISSAVPDAGDDDPSLAWHTVISEYKETNNATNAYGFDSIIEREMTQIDETDSTDASIRRFTHSIRVSMNNNGVKYYQLHVSYPEDDGDGGIVYVPDSTFGTVISAVAGTNSTSATRPFYLKNNTGGAISGRLVVFYQDASDNYQMQNMQAVTSNVYRVVLPSDVSHVVFAIADTAQRYQLPSVNSSGDLVYNNSYFTSRMTEWLDISGGEQCFLYSGDADGTGEDQEGEMIGSLGSM